MEGSAADEAPAHRAGPRRSDRARRAVLAAAVRLFARDGWHALTIEAIAASAQVGKATIYRWWPNKASVLMDALLEASSELAEFPDTGDAVEDLRLQLRAIVHLFTSTTTGRGLLALIAESQHDATLATALRDRLIASRRASATEVLERGRRRGELRSDLDPDLVIDAIYGAVYYRLLVSHEPPAADYVDNLLGQFAPALRSGHWPRTAG